MSKLIYLDTNIWLDYIQERKGKYLDLQDFACRILNRTLSCEFNILVSDIVLFELRKVCSTTFLHDFKKKLVFCRTQECHKQLARSIDIHYPDNVHVAIAITQNCAMIVSNDLEMQSLHVSIPIISSQDL